MASLQEFLGAVGMFNRSMNQIATQRNIGRAQEEREQIVGAGLDMAQERSKLKDLTARTTGSLIGLGVDPTHISQMAQTMGPENFGSASEAILEGVLASKPELVQQGVTAQNLIGKPDRDLRRELQDKQLAQARALKMFDMAKKQQQAELELSKDEQALFVPGFGVARTKEDARALKDLSVDINPAMSMMQDLINIDKQRLEELSLEARARASVMVNSLIGKLRVPLVGPGQMSEKELDLIKETVGDPTEVFTVTSQTKLKTLLQATQRVIDEQKKVRVRKDMGGIEQNMKFFNLPPAVQKALKMDPASVSNPKERAVIEKIQRMYK